MASSAAPVLITGAAGFIGHALAARYLDEGRAVVGVDSLDPYYDVTLKTDRLAQLQTREGFSFEKLDLADADATSRLFDEGQFQVVHHLAAQAGVRHSLENPRAYVQANLVAFLNVLEGCRRTAVGHLLYASSSSVYGASTRLPFSPHANVDHPISLYAATKKSNELMAHSYSWLFGLPTTGLRFFTVYGPWGRPDMAPMLFARAILAGEPIQVFNQGRMLRDFTYVSDVAEAVRRLADLPPAPDPAWRSDAPDPATSAAPWRIYNVGNSRPIELMRFIEVLESALGRKAKLELRPMQPGDVVATAADMSDLERLIGFTPSTPLEEGVARFTAWLRGR